MTMGYKNAIISLLLCNLLVWRGRNLPNSSVMVYRRRDYSCLIKETKVELEFFFDTFWNICTSCFCCRSLEASKAIDENFCVWDYVWCSFKTSNYGLRIFLENFVETEHFFYLLVYDVYLSIGSDTENDLGLTSQPSTILLYSCIPSASCFFIGMI